MDRTNQTIKTWHDLTSKKKHCTKNWGSAKVTSPARTSQNKSTLKLQLEDITGITHSWTPSLLHPKPAAFVGASPFLPAEIWRNHLHGKVQAMGILWGCMDPIYLIWYVTKVTKRSASLYIPGSHWISKLA
jgi:hypothetical protein